MTYELFQQGPAAYIPVIIASLVITLVAYGAFPLVFARIRKKNIAKKKYTLLCFGVNFFVMILFIIANGGYSSCGPYILWTWVFSAAGLKKLKRRGVLSGFQVFDYNKTATYVAKDVEENSDAEDVATVAKEDPLMGGKPQIKFCRKCGFEVIDGSEFCSRCGTAILKE